MRKFKKFIERLLLRFNITLIDNHVMVETKKLDKEHAIHWLNENIGREIEPLIFYFGTFGYIYITNMQYGLWNYDNLSLPMIGSHMVRFYGPYAKENAVRFKLACL